MNDTPIFIRAFDLHAWLLDRLDDETAVPRFTELRRTVIRTSEHLLESVSLALAHFEAPTRLVEADEHATVLRVHLRMATEKRLLDDRQLLYASGELADIGRQIGGWRRRVEGVD